MNTIEILDSNGNPVRSQRFEPCPKCGRLPKDRVPSAGFGSDIYMICPCGNEFNKEIKWEKPTQ